MKCSMLLVMIAIWCAPFIATAGGIHSGGGNGVATYRAGAPHTIENLIKVESWVLFKARRAGKLPLATKSSDPDLTPEMQYAKLVRDSHQALRAASPDFYLWFERGDQAFVKALDLARTRFMVSKEISDVPLTAQMDLVDDFGRRVTLDENQSLVQIVVREGDKFDINMSLWNKMDAIDRVDIRNHEDAYAVSWHDDSTRIQELQLYLIDHVLSEKPIDKADFERRAVSEWNLFQVRFPLGETTMKQSIPGLRIDDGSNRPYSDTGSTTAVQGVLPPGVPMRSRSEDLQCGMATDWLAVSRSSEIEILYWDGSKSQKLKKTLSDSEFSYVQQLKNLSGPAILSQLNPMKSPFLYDYMPVLCFQKSFFSALGVVGDLRYVEFRKAYDVEKAKKTWETSQTVADIRYAALIGDGIRAKIDVAFNLDANENATADQIKDKMRSMKSLIRKFNLPEFEATSLLIHLNAAALGIARSKMDSVNRMSRAKVDPYEFPILALEIARDRGMLDRRLEEHFMRENPVLLRPPPFVLYPGGSGSEIVPTADKITIVGRIGGYVESR